MTKDLKTPPLQLSQMQRTAQMMQDTAKLAMTSPAPGTFVEAADLGRAALDRVRSLQQGWVQDWMDWAEYAQAITGADTLPKFTDHAGNIAVRAQTQLVNQMTALSELSENVSVNYSYWVARQLEDRKS